MVVGLLAGASTFLNAQVQVQSLTKNPTFTTITGLTYVNFAATMGSTGYGLRDNGGNIEFKNSGGDWTAIPSAVATTIWDRSGTTIQPSNAGDTVIADGGLTVGRAATYDGILITPVVKGGVQANGTITSVDLTAARTWTLPDASGTFLFTTGSAANLTNFPTFNQDTSGNAATVTNGVYTTGNQTIAGVKTFSSTIVGNIDTVTNGVYTTNNLSVLAATTSAQFAGVISDETGTGLVVMNTSPIFATAASFGAIATQDIIKILPANSLTRFTGTITPSDLTADRTYSLPDGTGTLALAPTFTDGYIITSTATGFKASHDFNDMFYSAARCQGATATSFYNIPAGATGASPNCTVGTNLTRATIDYTDASNHTATVPVHLPEDADLTSDVSLEIYWMTSATAGAAIWSVSTACIPVGGQPDPTFNTAQTVTTTTNASSLYKNSSIIAALTLTGCTADTTLFVKIDRNGATAGDTIGATASILAIEVKYFRKWA